MTPSGMPGNSLQQAPGVGDDDRLGHAEAADPPRARLGEGRLDDRRAHDGDGQVGVAGDQGPLAERLGEGVGVGPAERLGPGPAGLDQLVAHPVLAQLLGPLGQEVGRRPRRARRGPPW